MVGSTKPGTRSTLTVFRRGAYKDLTVTIAEIEAEKPTAKSAEPEVKPKSSAVGQALGLSVTELTDAQKKELKIKGGVRVEASVEAAARAGIMEDDVIVAVGNTEVKGLKDFEAALNKADGRKPLALVIRRGEMAQIVVVRPIR
jgi:serine protease Do